MNARYRIRRRDMLAALGLSEKIPLGMTFERHNVKVTAGRDGKEMLLLPYVYVAPDGVANRVRVACPICEAEVRFSVLQQHAESKRCLDRLDARGESVADRI